MIVGYAKKNYYAMFHDPAIIGTEKALKYLT